MTATASSFRHAQRARDNRLATMSRSTAGSLGTMRHGRRRAQGTKSRKCAKGTIVLVAFRDIPAALKDGAGAPLAVVSTLQSGRLSKGWIVSDRPPSLERDGSGVLCASRSRCRRRCDAQVDGRGGRRRRLEHGRRRVQSLQKMVRASRTATSLSARSSTSRPKRFVQLPTRPMRNSMSPGRQWAVGIGRARPISATKRSCGRRTSIA